MPSYYLIKPHYRTNATYDEIASYKKQYYLYNKINYFIAWSIAIVIILLVVFNVTPLWSLAFIAVPIFLQLFTNAIFALFYPVNIQNDLSAAYQYYIDWNTDNMKWIPYEPEYPNPTRGMSEPEMLQEYYNTAITKSSTPGVPDFNPVKR